MEKTRIKFGPPYDLVFDGYEYTPWKPSIDPEEYYHTNYLASVVDGHLDYLHEDHENFPFRDVYGEYELTGTLEHASEIVSYYQYRRHRQLPVSKDELEYLEQLIDIYLDRDDPGQPVYRSAVEYWIEVVSENQPDGRSESKRKYLEEKLIETYKI